MHTNDMKNSAGSTPPAHVQTSITPRSRDGAIQEICAASGFGSATPIKNHMKKRTLQFGFRLLTLWLPLLVLMGSSSAQAAIAQRGTATSANTASSPLTINKPTGV